MAAAIIGRRRSSRIDVRHALARDYRDDPGYRPCPLADSCLDRRPTRHYPYRLSCPDLGARRPTFEALPGARAFFGNYEGGIYRIEIPEGWNGELMLSAHGFVSNGGMQGAGYGSVFPRFGSI